MEKYATPTFAKQAKWKRSQWERKELAFDILSPAEVCEKFHKISLAVILPNDIFQNVVQLLNNPMKKQISWIAFLTLTAVLKVSAGDVSGTVTLKGTPPPEKIIDITAECGSAHKGPMKTRFYAVNGKGQLADVVVALKGVPAKSSGASAKPFLVNQIGCEYVPYVFAVQTGQKVEVKNSDPIMHNVHFLPSGDPSKEANKAQPAKSANLEFTYGKPEHFAKFKCDVHGWMYTYMSVFDHPYFSVTDNNGAYKIANVPPGKYTVEFYHRKAAPADKPMTKEIEVKDSAVTADLEIAVK